MDEGIINEFQKKVKPEDHVYHLGDFMFGNGKMRKFLEIFEQLPGIWHFVNGNHDMHTINKWKNQLLLHERIEQIDHMIYKEYEDSYITMCHYEMKTWNHKNYRERNSKFKYKRVYHFFGHSHSSPSATYQLDTIDVGYDACGHQILTIDDQIKRIKIAIDSCEC